MPLNMGRAAGDVVWHAWLRAIDRAVCDRTMKFAMRQEHRPSRYVPPENRRFECPGTIFISATDAA